MLHTIIETDDEGDEVESDDEGSSMDEDGEDAAGGLEEAAFEYYDDSPP